MRIIVVGSGRLGSDLANRLFEKGHDVAVIDSVSAAFSNLPASFQGRVIEGDALSQDVLYRAGIERADAVAAVTNSDALNAVVGHIARAVYNIQNIVVRNYDPHSRSMHEAFGAQIVSSTVWGAQKMEELIYGVNLRAVYSAGNGEVELYEMTIPNEWTARDLSGLLLDNEATVISVTRAGRAEMAGPDTRVSPGDVVMFSATLEGIRFIREQLGKMTEA